MQRNMYSPKHRLNRASFATTSALHCRSKTRTHTLLEVGYKDLLTQPDSHIHTH